MNCRLLGLIIPALIALPLSSCRPKPTITEAQGTPVTERVWVTVEIDEQTRTGWIERNQQLCTLKRTPTLVIEDGQVRSLKPQDVRWDRSGGDQNCTQIRLTLEQPSALNRSGAPSKPRIL